MKTKMKDAKELLKEKLAQFTTPDVKPQQYISQEFQDFGYRLALRLNDLPKKAYYIRIAKVMPRALIEDAAAFATDYPKARNKGKIFTWRLRELVEEYRVKHPEFGLPTKAKRKSQKKAPKTKKTKPRAKQLGLLQTD